jgi:hypothetical protein
MLTDSAKLAINEYVGGLLQKWLAWVGIGNLVALVGALVYVLFVLPDKAVSDVSAKLSPKLEEMRDELVRKKEQLKFLATDVDAYSTQFEKLRKAIDELAKDGSIEQTAKLLSTLRGSTVLLKNLDLESRVNTVEWNEPLM